MGKSVDVACMKWFSKLDLLSLNINELNFEKIVEGKRHQLWKIAHYVGNIIKIFDLLGKFTPIRVEIRLSELSKRIGIVIGMIMYLVI